MEFSRALVNFTLMESNVASRELRLELSLNTSLVEADNALVRIKFALKICDWALARATFAFASAEFTLVTARLARLRLNDADEVALLAF